VVDTQKTSDEIDIDNMCVGHASIAEDRIRIQVHADIAIDLLLKNKLFWSDA